jgi:predicted PurR-regulated permease PerM
LAHAETQNHRLVADIDAPGTSYSDRFLRSPASTQRLGSFFNFAYFHSLIAILVGASLVAFLLNYPVSWMERQGAQRQPVAILVF